MSPKSLSHRLDVRSYADVVLVHFTGPKVMLDEEAAQQVAEKLLKLADRLAGRTLLLSFAGVTYLTSTLLGKLMALHKRAQTAGGRLALRDLRPEVYELFQVTRLHTVLDVLPEERPTVSDMEMPDPGEPEERKA